MLQVVTHRQKDDTSNYNPSERRYKLLHTVKKTLQVVRHRQKMFQVDTHRQKDVTRSYTLSENMLQIVAIRQKDIIRSYTPSK